jgi:ArsR family transcriptional regulator
MDWDEMRALGLPAAAIEQALLEALPPRMGAFLDIGTGTGRLLELVAPEAERAIGVDMSRDMLALARARLAERGLADRAAVRQADMYRLPFADAAFDAVALQMVLHYAEDPAAAVAEAVRVLKPGGVLLIADLVPHDRAELISAHAHRWPGFDDAEIAGWLGAAGCAPLPSTTLAGPLSVRIWPARRQPATAALPVS